jgi:spermidine synthase
MYMAPTLERYGTLRELTEHDESCTSTLRTYSGAWNFSYDEDDEDNDEHRACMSR